MSVSYIYNYVLFKNAYSNMVLLSFSQNHIQRPLRLLRNWRRLICWRTKHWKLQIRKLPVPTNNLVATWTSMMAWVSDALQFWISGGYIMTYKYLKGDDSYDTKVSSASTYSSCTFPFLLFEFFNLVSLSFLLFPLNLLSLYRLVSDNSQQSDFSNFTLPLPLIYQCTCLYFFMNYDD